MCHWRDDSWDLNIPKRNGQLDHSSSTSQSSCQSLSITSFSSASCRRHYIAVCVCESTLGQSIGAHTGPIGSIKSCPTVVCPSLSLTHPPATCQEYLLCPLRSIKHERIAQQKWQRFPLTFIPSMRWPLISKKVGHIGSGTYQFLSEKRKLSILHLGK